MRPLTAERPPDWYPRKPGRQLPDFGVPVLPDPPPFEPPAVPDEEESENEETDNKDSVGAG
ncbi:MAG: hypothetical protein AB7I33_00555 [Gemmatimonadales bacterium]